MKFRSKLKNIHFINWISKMPSVLMAAILIRPQWVDERIIIACIINELLFYKLSVYMHTYINQSPFYVINKLKAPTYCRYVNDLTFNFD